VVFAALSFIKLNKYLWTSFVSNFIQLDEECTKYGKILIYAKSKVRLSLLFLISRYGILPVVLDFIMKNKPSVHNLYCSDCEGSLHNHYNKSCVMMGCFSLWLPLHQVPQKQESLMSLCADNLQHKISPKSVPKYQKYKHKFICTLLPLSGVMMTVTIRINSK
jgi:hypothetical protein